MHGRARNRQLDQVALCHPSFDCYSRSSHIEDIVKNFPHLSSKMASFQDRAQHAVAQLDKEVR